MVDGDPGFDVWGMDVARFGDYATLRYTNAKVRENYSRRFSISFPNEELPAGRPHMTTPIYDRMLSQHAVMGNSWGLETPLWFAPSKAEAFDKLSFYRSNDFEHIGREVKAARDSVGITEIANFAKYKVSGTGAKGYLSELMCNRLPKAGRIILTPMLNEKGKLIGDFTIAKTGAEEYMIWGSQQAQVYHMRWFEKHLPSNGSVLLHCFDQLLVGLSIAGPNSTAVLQKLCDDDVSTETFRFMDHRKMDVAASPCQVNRLSFSGDLGYEIWMEPAYQLRVYDAIMQAGKEYDIVNFGMRALLSMRLEKNFPTWFAELRPIYGPFEAGMDFFIKLDKESFIGKEAALQEFEQGPILKRVSLIIEAENADVISDEPIWARVGDKEFNHISKPHGLGPSRFDADGNSIQKETERQTRDGDWSVIGWVTSGGYAHYVELSMAQGYLPAELANNEEEDFFEIEILGKRYPARISKEAPFDPSGSRMRE